MTQRRVSPERQMSGEIRRYLNDNPQLRPHEERFIEYVTDRMHGVVYRIAMACRSLGIESTKDPEYKRVETRVESLYPTWEEIADALVSNREPVFPDD